MEEKNKVNYGSQKGISWNRKVIQGNAALEDFRLDKSYYTIR